MCEKSFDTIAYLDRGITQRDVLAEKLNEHPDAASNVNFHSHFVGVPGQILGEHHADMAAEIRYARVFSERGVRIDPTETKWDFKDEAGLSVGFMRFAGKLGQLTLQGSVHGVLFRLKDTEDRALASGLFNDLVDGSSDRIVY